MIVIVFITINSTAQSPSWGAGSCSVVQEMLRLLWTRLFGTVFTRDRQCSVISEWHLL